MMYIPLSKGKVAIIDDADFDRIKAHKWHVLQTGKSKWYAVRTVKLNGRKHMIYMHRELLNPPSYVPIDHIDGNGLNNQRDNIRLANARVNALNKGVYAANQSGFRGVHFDKQTGRYRATIRVNGKTINLKRYGSAQDAAKAYDQAAIIYNGEFARLNFPEQVQA